MKTWPLATLLLAVTAACGSTAPGSAAGGSGGPAAAGVTSVGSSGQGGTGGLAVPAPAGSAASGGSPAAGSAQQPGGNGAVTGGTAVTGGGPSGSGRTAGLVPAQAPGVTATTVYVGIPYSSQSASGDQAIGAAGAAPSYDARSVFDAVVNYANAHGGFAGRKMVPLYYDYNLTTATSTQDQSACADWTQDNKSFVILVSDDQLRQCAEAAGAISLGFGGDTAQTFASYAHYVDPDGIRLDRLGVVTVNGLYRAGYFAGKLGLVTWDAPEYHYAMTHGYLPALAAHGIQVAAPVAYIAVPQDVGALGGSSAGVSSAVAKFKSLGIDHVIIQDGPAGVWAGTGLTFEWMEQAKSQNYFPRYGQNADNSPGWDVLPSDEMNDALAIDQSDYQASFDAGWHTNAARDKCFAIEAAAGYPVNSSNANNEGIAAEACDVVFFTQQVINKLDFVTASSFISAVAGLGTSFDSALVYGTKLVPGVRDGGDEVRTEEYLASCQCLVFRGPPYYAD